MNALQASLLIRPLPSSLPPRRRLPLSHASASVSFPRAPHRNRLPLSLRALAADGPRPAPSPAPEPHVDAAAAAAPEAEVVTAPAAKDGKEEMEDLVEKARSWAMAFAAAVVAAARRFLEWVVSGDWMSWWPFWRPDRRLQRLIDEADSNPKDAAKQSALLHELNKYRCAREG